MKYHPKLDQISQVGLQARGGLIVHCANYPDNSIINLH